MAGSAGSPPSSITVYVCCEGCDYTQFGRGTGVHQTFDPKDPFGRMVVHELHEVEYVPREQSDALLTTLRAIAQRMPHGTVTDENWCAVVEIAEEANEALDSYREATAGEDEDG